MFVTLVFCTSGGANPSSPLNLPGSSVETIQSAAPASPVGDNAMTVPVTPVVRINNGSAWDTRFAVFVVAGQELNIQSEAGGLAQQWEGDGEFVLKNSAQGAIGASGSTLTWRAPKTPGSAVLVMKTAGANGWTEAARVNVQVMAPMNQLANGVIDGYRIGRYPSPTSKTDVTYVPPQGFLKVGRTSEKTPISPRFFLEDFMCKQAAKGAKYVALQQRLLPFLEAIAARVEQEGFVARNGANVQRASHDHDHDHGTAEGRSITIMSGYRTPAYNASLGTADLSRHQYGDASDIIIDSNGDGRMDDLNRDGRVNGRDAYTLAAWIEQIWERPEFKDRPGGLGVYNGTDSHGPFVHVDLRGKRARWGGNGLEWSDAAVDRAGRIAKDGPAIQNASVVKKAPARHASKTRKARRSAGSVVKNAATARR
jgi:hypothetical protein